MMTRELQTRGGIGRSTLITVGLVVILILLLYQILFGGSEPPDFTPVISGNEQAEVLVLPNPISATALIEDHERAKLAVISKFGSDRPEPAQLHLIGPDADGTLEIISTLDSPFDVLSPPTAITAHDGNLYVGLFGEDRSDPTLWVIEIGTDGELISRNNFPLDAALRDLAILNDGRLLGSGFDGDFHLFGLTDSANPRVIAGFRIPVSVAPDIKVAGDVVLINHMAGVVLVEAENDLRFSEVGRIDHPDWQIPISAPRSAGLLTQEERFDFDVPIGNFLGIAIDGDSLFIAASDLGLLIYDIQDPRDPQRLDSIPSTGRVVSAAATGDIKFALSGVPGQEEDLRFTVHRVDPERNAYLDSSAPTLEISGTPRFLDLMFSDERLLMLFNDAVISVTGHNDESGSSP